jgi:RND family efflux transporter MFP subunit
MTRNRMILIGAAVLLVAAGAFLLLTHHGASDAPTDDASPTASITTAPVAEQTLRDVTTVYGVVQADPAGSTTLATPRAVTVVAVLVRAGQSVAAGQALAEVASAPAADLAYRQAADGATSAQTDLARVQRLYDAHLAASDQLIAAKKTLADAQAALSAQQAQGAGQRRQTLTAATASVVMTVSVAPGDHVAQDAPLMVLARRGALSVKLGVEPASRFSVGQVVLIRPVNGGPSLTSRLTMVGGAADAATKTIDAIAPVSNGAPAIGSAVEADIVTGAHQGLTVPRAAVVSDETGAHLFVVANGKARRVFVTVGHDAGDQAEISGGVQAGDQVAVQGAYELQDGMAVKVAAQ